MPTRPNVVLLITDDQGMGDLSCYGAPVLKTPCLDQLYEDGVRLTDYHVDPMCSPTRAALMSGNYSARAGVWSTLRGRYYLRRDQTTMAEVFADSGYRTALFGKWHLGDIYPYRPHDRGFHETLTFGGGVVGEIPDYWNNNYFTATYSRNGEPEECTSYCTDLWFDEAIKFIERNRDDPFFCAISTNAPHGPHEIHDKYADPYRQAGMPEQRAKYFGMIACIDENLGRLRARLRELELEDDTILIFMGDNGGTAGMGMDRDGFVTDGFNAGLRGKKCWAYEGGHRNACFLHWKNGGLVGSRDVGHVTAHFDMIPTLVDLCDLKEPEREFDGTSLAPILRDDKSDWPDRTLFVHNQQVDTPERYKDFSAMTDDWRLVRTKQWGRGARGLYDIAADLGQRHDLEGKESLVAGRLLEAYDGWWESLSDRFAGISEMVVGADEQNPTFLTAHSWHGKEGLYNQRHVRPGLVDNGWWQLDVMRAGLYEFSLSRWPVEADTPIRDSVPPIKDVPFVKNSPAGEPLPICEARIQIDGIAQCKAVKAGDKAIVFEVPLAIGATRLQTWFIDEQGVERGAYYVQVRRV